MDSDVQQPAEQHYTRPAEGLKIPYDEAPFDAHLMNGEKVRLYGNIEIENDTGVEAYVCVRFDLRQGFILTVMGPHVEFDTKIQMHTKHALKIVDGHWELVSRNFVE